MDLSVIVPAYNEEKLLPRCLHSIRSAFARVGDGVEWEVIVTDNNSTDDTARVAARGGARVVFEGVNQIARARNAGAAIARGRWLLFLDADSRLAPGTLTDLLATLRRDDVVGGGCVVGLIGAPWIGHAATWLWNRISRSARWAAGSFLFCRARAFREVGGFDSAYYAGEEIDLSRRLKRWARLHGQRFRILRRHPHLSSGRKFELYSGREILGLLFRLLTRGRRALRGRAGLDFYYDGRR